MQIYADMDRIDRIESDMANGLKPGYEQVSEWMETLGDERLYELARRIRMRRDGRRIDMCSIMNARSGRCSEDCKWCAQSKFHKTDIEVYPLVGEQEAVREAAHNASKGVRRFSLVTSGRALSDGETDRVCGIYRRIGSEVDISLCASLGLLSKEQLVGLRQSGVRRYHCNLETAPSYFGELCTTHTQQQKLQTIAWAREAGLEICCGGIIGMGESERQRIEFALAIRDTGAVSVPMNVLNPIPGTRLEKALPLSDRDVLRAAALMQIVNPDASVRLAGGRSRIKHLEPELFRCGVSASIVGDLLTTSGSDIDTDKAMFKKWGFGI